MVHFINFLVFSWVMLTYFAAKCVMGATASAFQNEDYYMDPALRLNYAEATEFCLRINATLARIFTAQQNQSLRYFLQANESAWFALTSGYKSNDTWWWPSPTIPVEITYQNWQSGQPTGENHCLATGGFSSGYGWFSVACNNKHVFVCDKN